MKTLRSGSLAEMDHAPELVGGLEQENDVCSMYCTIVLHDTCYSIEYRVYVYTSHEAHWYFETLIQTRPI